MKLDFSLLQSQDSIYPSQSQPNYYNSYYDNNNSSDSYNNEGIIICSSKLYYICNTYH